MFTTITITFPILWSPSASGHSGGLQFCAYSRTSIMQLGANLAKARSVSKSYDDRSIEYQRREFLQNLARLGFLCHMALCEFEEAVEYFHRHYVREEPEI